MAEAGFSVGADFVCRGVDHGYAASAVSLSLPTHRYLSSRCKATRVGVAPASTLAITFHVGISITATWFLAASKRKAACCRQSDPIFTGTF